MNIAIRKTDFNFDTFNYNQSLQRWIEINQSKGVACYRFKCFQYDEPSLSEFERKIHDPLSVEYCFFMLERLSESDHSSEVFSLQKVFQIEPNGSLHKFQSLINALMDYGYRSAHFRNSKSDVSLEIPMSPFSEYRNFGDNFQNLAKCIFLTIKKIVDGNKSTEWYPPYLRLAWMAWDGDSLPADLKEDIAEITTHEFALIRKCIFDPEKSEDEKKENFKSKEQNLECCCALAMQTRGMWSMLKPSILMLRELKQPALACDLRYWSNQPKAQRAPLIEALKREEMRKEEISHNELPSIDHEYINEQCEDAKAWREELLEVSVENPPEVWSSLPGMMILFFNRFVAQEQVSDEKLIICRKDFARFCLDRLKIKKDIPNNDKRTKFIEHSKVWRKFYIRASSRLHINPDSKGHHTLYSYGVDEQNREENDPDLQSEAKDAYEKMRKCKNLPLGLSPRRAIIDALSELFEAHLTDLGITVDKYGAKRTREQLARRTKERKNLLITPQT